MKKNYLITFLTIFLLNSHGFSIEPFVVLEYRGGFKGEENKKIDKDNKFIRDQNYSAIHKVNSGESLSGILNNYYGNTGLNMRVVELSVIEINKHAFVRNNPHFLYAGKKIKIPSVNEIMNLVKQKPNKNTHQTSNKRNHIYFYGN